MNNATEGPFAKRSQAPAPAVLLPLPVRLDSELRYVAFLAACAALPGLLLSQAGLYTIFSHPMCEGVWLAPDLKSGTAQAQTLLRSGEVIAKLESLREVCRRVHPTEGD